MADSGHQPSQRDEAVAAFEQEMASGSRIDDALLPGEAEEFAEQHFIAGYMAAAESRDQRIKELEPLVAALRAARSGQTHSHPILDQTLRVKEGKP